MPPDATIKKVLIQVISNPATVTTEQVFFQRLLDLVEGAA